MLNVLQDCCLLNYNTIDNFLYHFKVKDEYQKNGINQRFEEFDHEIMSKKLSIFNF